MKNQRIIKKLLTEAKPPKSSPEQGELFMPEYEVIESYDGIRFAENHSDQVPDIDDPDVKEGILLVYNEFMGKQEADFDNLLTDHIVTLADYASMTYDYIAEEVPEKWMGYIDLIAVIKDESLNGAITIIKFMGQGYLVFKHWD